MGSGVRRCLLAAPNPSTGLSIECRSCHRCGPLNGWHEMEEAIVAKRGEPLDPRVEDWVQRSIAWTRCSSLAVYHAEEHAKDAAKRIREVRAETSALQTVRRIFNNRLERVERANQDDDDELGLGAAIRFATTHLETTLREIDLETSRRERITEVASGDRVRDALFRAEPDVFSDVDIRLNKKHALDPLVFECVTIWPAITGDDAMQIGRPDSHRPPPFLRFLIAATKPLEKPLCLTRNSLCDRARLLLGRRPLAD